MTRRVFKNKIAFNVIDSLDEKSEKTNHYWQDVEIPFLRLNKNRFAAPLEDLLERFTVNKRLGNNSCCLSEDLKDGRDVDKEMEIGKLLMTRYGGGLAVLKRRNWLLEGISTTVPKREK